MAKPLVSVILPCYREPLPWFKQAIESITQQSLKDLEIIVVIDDPSNSALCDYLAELSKNEDRLLIIKNPQNVGLPSALNLGLSKARGKFIARMDADDISHVERLKRQSDFLLANNHISLVGTSIENIDEHNVSLGITNYFEDEKLIRKVIPFCSVACHPTWLFKRELIEDVGGYRELQGAEDYDFLYRVIDAGKGISNINEPLLSYRLHNESITSSVNLNRYRIRQYILRLHDERVASGKDSYSKEKVDAILSSHKNNELVSKLITRVRKAEASKSISKLVYLVLLFLMSSLVRSRVIDQLKLKIIIMFHMDK